MNPYIDHVYKNKYSLLPNLKKINDEPIFIFNDTFNYLEKKKKAVEKNQCFFEHDIDKKTYEVICEFMHYQTKIKKSNFEEMAMNLQEDIAIHKVSKEKDWLASCHICFPSGWYPEEKIGKSFDEIHKPIPGMNLKNSAGVVKSMVNNGPFVRFVWGICHERQLSQHPSIPSKEFDPKNPKVWVKVERQVTVGFKEIDASLFVIRQEVIEPEEIDYKSLYETCCGMTEEQRSYKRISNEFMLWLKGFTAT